MGGGLGSLAVNTASLKVIDFVVVIGTVWNDGIGELAGCGFLVRWSWDFGLCHGLIG